MPELPEVETVRKTLEVQLGHPQIADVNIRWPRIIDNVTPEQFATSLKNETIREYRRIGKYLIFELDHYVLVSHLRMEGKYYVQLPSEPFQEKHTHLIIAFTDGRQLRYHDTRKFGRFYLYDRHTDLMKQKAFAHCSYDVFDERVNAQYLYDSLHHRHIVLKQALLDQSVMAGIGNIYADEICFALRRHPETPIARLHKPEYKQLLHHTRRILSNAIECGGTTIRSYTSSLGVDGRFQLQLQVHAKADEPCPICGSVIRKKFVATRGTYYCPKCQRKRR